MRMVCLASFGAELWNLSSAWNVSSEWWAQNPLWSLFTFFLRFSLERRSQKNAIKIKINLSSLSIQMGAHMCYNHKLNFNWHLRRKILGYIKKYSKYLFYYFPFILCTSQECADAFNQQDNPDSDKNNYSGTHRTINRSFHINGYQPNCSMSLVAKAFSPWPLMNELSARKVV